MKEVAILLVTLLLVTGCTTARQRGDNVSTSDTAKPIDYRYAVETPNSAPVDAASYNRMIASQGHDHYCGTGRCDQPPQLVSGNAPLYPAALQSAGITGSATIIFMIDEQGNVVDARVESATRPEFSAASIGAVQTWKFKPASLRGKPVRMSSRQQFPFDLR